MNINRKRLFLKILLISFILLIAVLTISGCKSKREMNELGIVLITGIDYDLVSDLFEVTINSVRPVPGGAGIGGGEVGKGQIIPWISSEKGNTIMEASKNLRRRSSGDLTWLHSEVIIVGQDAATHQLKEVIDFFTRNREVRMTNLVFITEGKAQDILKLTPEMSSSLSNEITGIANNIPEWGKTDVLMLKKVIGDMEEEYSDPLIGKISAAVPVPFEKQPMEKIANQKTSDKVVAIEGSAVIRGDRLAGWLNGLETRGYRWISEKKGSFVISIQKENKEDIFSTIIEINKNKRKAVINSDGSISFQFYVECTGLVTEHNMSTMLMDDKHIKTMEADVESKIKSEIQAFLDKAQKTYHSDLLSMGQLVFIRNPALWKKIKNDWYDKIYPNIPVNIEVSCKINRTGMIF